MCFNFWINTNMLSNLDFLFNLYLYKALLKDWYCLKRATSIFESNLFKVYEQLATDENKTPNPKAQENESQGTSFTLCTPLYISPVAPRPIYTFVCLIHIILNGTVGAHFYTISPTLESVSCPTPHPLFKDLQGK